MYQRQTVESLFGQDKEKEYQEQSRRFQEKLRLEEKAQFK